MPKHEAAMLSRRASAHGSLSWRRRQTAAKLVYVVQVGYFHVFFINFYLLFDLKLDVDTVRAVKVGIGVPQCVAVCANRTSRWL